MELTAEAIAFLILSAVTIGGAVAVVITRNLMHAGLYLMVSLLGVAGLFALLAAPFLAVVQVVVYIGAIAILIVLGVALTPHVTEMTHTHNLQWPYALAVAVLFFFGAVFVVSPLLDDLGVDDFSANFTEENPDPVPADSMMTLGEKLVDPDGFMLPFEVASVLLMAAMIGAVFLVWPREEDDVVRPAVAGELVDEPGDEITGG